MIPTYNFVSILQFMNIFIKIAETNEMQCFSALEVFLENIQKYILILRMKKGKCIDLKQNWSLLIRTSMNGRNTVWRMTD